jgi:S-adenosylmethionine:tRNA ribosyltransferase-isomerase
MILALADYDFALPPELIAQHPTAERSASRLLDGTGPQAQDRVFRDLPGLLSPGDLLVFNDTRVIKARLFGRKASGGAVEALVERVLPSSEGRGGAPGVPHAVWAHLRASKSPKPGSVLRFGRRGAGAQDAFEQGFDAEVLGRCGPDGELFHLALPSDPFALLEAFGHVPLPPYITHEDAPDDERRYQTIFAARPGAVAAPTASLHFDEAVLAALQARGVGTARVTLHVGAGTFQPVRAERIEDHRMHSEWGSIDAATADRLNRIRENGGRLIAVGTTSLRLVESAADQNGIVHPFEGDTDIFITPGYRFKAINGLMTNFHLPKSTLFMLVSALMGRETMQAAYAYAIAEEYRFYSYGDSSLLLP